MDRGFTLVELMVTVVIVGILAGMSIAHYQNYREKAKDLTALSAIKNVITAQEAYHVDNDIYLSACYTGPERGSDSDCTLELPGLPEYEKDIELATTSSRIDGLTFSAVACSRKGTVVGVIATFSSDGSYSSQASTSQYIYTNNENRIYSGRVFKNKDLTEGIDDGAGSVGLSCEKL